MIWTIGGYGNEVPIREAFEFFAWHCQAVGFPKYPRTSDLVERETMTEWLEIGVQQASSRQMQGDKDAVGNDLIGSYHVMMPTMDAWRGASANKQDVLA
jgi:hypothetical protein